MGLEALASVQDLSVAENGGLLYLSGLEALTEVGGSLDISRNNVLTSLSGLDALTVVGEDLTISYNLALPTADAEALVAQLTAIGGTVTIEGNAP